MGLDVIFSDQDETDLNQVNFNGVRTLGIELTRTDGLLTQVDEKMDTVLRRRTTLTRTGGLLASINVKIYQADGITVEQEYTDTLTRSEGILTSVARTVV